MQACEHKCPAHTSAPAPDSRPLTFRELAGPTRAAVPGRAIPAPRAPEAPAARSLEREAAPLTGEAAVVLHPLTFFTLVSRSMFLCQKGSSSRPDLSPRLVLAYVSAEWTGEGISGDRGAAAATLPPAPSNFRCAVRRSLPAAKNREQRGPISQWQAGSTGQPPITARRTHLRSLSAAQAR